MSATLTSRDRTWLVQEEVQPSGEPCLEPCIETLHLSTRGDLGLRCALATFRAEG